MDLLYPWFSNFRVRQNHLETLLKQISGLPPRVYDSIDLRWGPRICVLIHSQVMLTLLTQGPHFENHFSNIFIIHSHIFSLYSWFYPLASFCDSSTACTIFSWSKPYTFHLALVMSLTLMKGKEMEHKENWHQLMGQLPWVQSLKSFMQRRASSFGQQKRFGGVRRFRILSPIMSALGYHASPSHVSELHSSHLLTVPGCKRLDRANHLNGAANLQPL